MGRASNDIPTLRYGNKIYPEDLAGVLGLPTVGSVIYVDPSSGIDTNGGGTQEDALATVSAAYAKATSGQHDVVLISPSGGTGRASESTAISWAKRFTHLIGSSAPTVQDARAGISFATGGSLTMSENGCIFRNFTLTSSADIDSTVSLTGSYNSFSRVDFKGTSNATSADSTPWRALTISGGQENTFDECTFGADTMTRGVANSTLEFASAASRNVFNNCRFVMHNDTANTPTHVLFSGTNSVDRWVEFNTCSFYSFWTNHSDKTAAVFDLSAQTATCDVLMTGGQGANVAIGFDDWEASASNFIWFPPFSDGTDNGLLGLAVNNA